MKRTLLITAALLAFGVSEAWPHGGVFRGPNSAVPPGLRTPHDPEPPPPPPTDPGGPRGPETGAPDPFGPSTGHPDTGSGGGPAPQPVPSTGGKRRGKTPSLTFNSWRFWWAYNNDDILNLKSHIYKQHVTSSSPFHFGGADRENRRNVQRPTQRAIYTSIIPALLRTINRPGDHEDIHGGAIVALGKVGSAKYIDLFQAATWNKFRNRKGQRMDFGYQATESAVLALGLLPHLDQPSKDAVRRICLEAIADEGLRTRERSWAAVALGLQRDEGAVAPLLALLKERYADDNVPAGILAGLGLIGSPEAVPALREAFVTGDLMGRRIQGDRIRAFVGYALAKIGDPSALPEVLKVIGSRKFGRFVKRSAVIAAGTLGAKVGPKMQEKTVQALLKYLRRSGGDAAGENFAIIALSQVGTDQALHALLDIAANGKYGQRPFAALGLGTHVFYKKRDVEDGRGAPMDLDLELRIVRKLGELSTKVKDQDTKAAFMLARGLVKDKSAIAELVEIASHTSRNPVLRGFCCVSLGLIGDARPDVKDALKLALKERRSTDLRRDAATGLGLLHDQEVVDLLLRELRRAKSFAVQGQLITAIGTIGDHGAVDALVRLLDDPSQPAQTRAMAAVGLGMIGDLREMPPLGRLSKNYNYRASVADIDELLYIL